MGIEQNALTYLLFPRWISKWYAWTPYAVLMWGYRNYLRHADFDYLRTV
jgi:hypothetical protein